MGDLYRLSIEEVAFLIGYLGEHAAAAGYLTSIIGQQESENMTGRITAASHSLIARQLLKIGSSAADTSLEPSLDRLVKGMSTTTRSLRCEKIVNGQTHLQTIFLGDEIQVFHEISEEVVATLKDVTGDDEVTRQVVAFTATPDGEAGAALGEISLEQLGEIRRNAGEQAELLSFLSQSVSDEIAQEIAQDAGDVDAVWGSVIVLDTADGSAETPLESNAGVFILSTNDRGWFFEANESGIATVYRSSAERMKELLKAMS